MNARLPNKAMPKRSLVETTVFQSGNSQAIRIPKEFQFHTKRVEIFREGNAIVLRPLPTTAAEALADLAPLSAAEGLALDQAMGHLDDLLALDEPPSDPLPRRSSTTARKPSAP
ncbi:AbrB/MazE/SpoVT family DNA-binding domain-containing protein [Rhodoferax sp. U2-2l]|uniref:antitoxin n=1 Tax=Rhodoferax sp. U2-2l TaxID=2884000 RepID=UPI001D0A9182|nr:AbrB/MazE/SpoVT family DNA-binding domain-containing protein [Rhodoferax sp. U2-2l]MCB8746946.1 AbrB/MazE/SpoVT family DNA-binding domain-containing protein [Rhodoferax sp. U2-2l]